MSDMDDDDFAKFTDDDDRVRPIDMDGDRSAGDKKKKKEEEPVGGVMLKPGESFLKDDDWGPDPGNTVPDYQTREAQPAQTGDVQSDDDIMNFAVDTRHNFIKKGEVCDLTEKDPTIKRLTIGAGWDQRAMEGEPVDVDLSLFLLDRADMTRVNEDFVFYNNMKGCDGAVQHLMDSRSGAGDGDDENIFIDLHGVPFDIIKIVFVFSIYDPEYSGHNFTQIKNLYFRIVNKDDNNELVRYQIADDDMKGNAIVIGTMIREGPRWILEATTESATGGLARVATQYGMVIKELQSTGETGEVQEDKGDGY